MLTTILVPEVQHERAAAVHPRSIPPVAQISFFLFIKKMRPSLLILVTFEADRFQQLYPPYAALLH